MGDLPECRIDTGKHHCFLCLKQSFPKNVNDDAFSVTNSSQLCSLQVLLRYLKMDINKQLYEKGHELIQIPLSLPLNVGEDNSKLKVGLCHMCASQVENFSDLYQQLERIRMDMEMSLEVIRGKLATSGEASHSDDKSFRSAFTGTGANPGKYFIGNLKVADVLPIRREMAEKCANKLVANPRVEVRRLTKEQVGKPNSKILKSQRQAAALEGVELEPPEEASGPDSDSDYEMENFDKDKSQGNSDGTGDDDSDSFNIQAEVTNKDKKIPEGHVNLDTGKYGCFDCPKEFTAKTSYTEHYRTAHLQIRYKCAKCRKEFNYKSDYNRHYKSVHLKVENHFKCRVCGKYFTKKSNLRIHHQSAHLKLKVRCKLCSATFSNVRNLRRHEQSRCPNRIEGGGDVDPVAGSTS